MDKPKPMPKYWELFQEVTHLHGYLDKLKAENEKLKLERDYWHIEASRAQYDWGESFKQSYRRKNEIADLKEENDKLRELVTRMVRAFRVGTEWCDYGCAQEFGCVDTRICPIVKAMRELGIKEETTND